MKKILALCLSIALSFSLFGQVTLVGPEPFTSTLGIFTSSAEWVNADPTPNSSTYTGASGGNCASINDAPFAVGVTLTTATFSTVGKTACTIKFSEWLDDVSFPTTDIGIEYSINGGSNYTDAGYTSAATTSSETVLQSFSLPAIDGQANVRIRFYTKNGLTGSGAAYFMDDFSVEGTAALTNYYNVSGANINLVASWGTNSDGSGISPANFTSSLQVFNLLNGSTAPMSAVWTVSGSGSKIIIGDGSNAITVNATFNISGSVDIANLGKLVLSASTITPGVTFGTLSSGSTVEYAKATANQNIKSATYYNLTISGGGTKTIPIGTTTVTNTLAYSGSATIALGVNTLTIGSLSGNPLLSTTATSNLAISNTVGTPSISLTTPFSINKLTLSGGTVNLGTNLVLDGSVPTLSIATGATLNTGTYIIDGTVATELIDLQGTVQTSNLSGFSSGASTTFTSNVSAPTMGANSTVHYNANSGTQVVTPFPEVNAYANLTMSGGATKDFNGDDFYINKDFVVSGGNCTLSSTSLFKFTGADQNIAGISYYEVEVSGSGIKTLSSTDSTKINTSLTIGANTQVVTNGKLVLQSLVGSNAAVIIDNTSGANGISGNVMVKRYLGNKEDANPANPPAWFLSSPVSGIALSAFKVANNNIYQYINSKTAGTRWTVISQYGSVATGKGYLVRSYANKTNYYYGTVNSGDISVPLTAAGDNWNLIGNPYPSQIEWDADKIDMTHVGGSKECKVYTGTGNPPYTFKTEGNTLIAVGQAVFVQAVTNGNLVFSNASRTTQATGGTLLRQESDYTNRMELYLRKNNRSSDMAVIWAQNSPARSNKYDLWYDMNKIMPGSTAPALYMTKENNNIDLFAFGVNEGSVNVPLTTYLPVDTTYTFEFNDIQKIDPAYSVYLVDNDQNTVQDLRESSTYKFTSTTGTKNRFSVQFSTVVTNVSTDDFLENQFSVYSENGLAQISAGGVPTKVLVRDISGKIVYDLASPNNKQITADLSDHPAGIYIATIETPTKVLNKKFVLNK